MSFDLPLVIESIPQLLRGAGLSLQIAFFGAILGLGLGGLLGIALSQKGRIVRGLANAYVTLVRGTPMLVQILALFYLLPELGVEISPIWSASLAIGLNSAAYIAEVVRAGIGSVPVGQVEAARTLGMSEWAITCQVVMPQAIRTILPALGNEFVILVKDSSLASVIGVMELSKVGSMIRSRTYDAFTILIAVACVYLALTSLLSYFVKRLEKRFHASAQKAV